MRKDFKQFLLRGNVVDLAVGIVIGAAFGALVTGFVTAFITPLIALVAGKSDLSKLVFDVGGTKFPYGLFLNALIAFVLIAAAVFFLVVRPINALMARRKTEPPVDPTVRDCPECLSSIPRAATRCAFCSVEVAPAA